MVKFFVCERTSGLVVIVTKGDMRERAFLCIVAVDLVDAHHLVPQLLFYKHATPEPWDQPKTNVLGIPCTLMLCEAP
jgi:hypothetical protein